MYEKLNERNLLHYLFIELVCWNKFSQEERSCKKAVSVEMYKKKLIIIQRRRTEVGVYYKGTADKRRKFIFKLTAECLADLNKNREAGEHEILE